MACEKTITLTGTEQKVAVEGHFCDLRNDGAGVVYISRCPGIEPDADGVVSVPPGQAVKYCCVHGVVYLLGEGKVMLCGNDYSNPVFKGAATSSGEGGVAQSYVDMQDADTLNRAKDYAEGIISNPNLLINPDFSINQRGQTEYKFSKDTEGLSDSGCTFDGWGLTMFKAVTTGVVTITRDNSEVTVTNGCDNTVRYLQQLEYNATYLGQTFTMCALIDGQKVWKTFVCAADGTEYKAYINDGALYVMDGTTGIVVALQVGGGATMTFSKPKLEPNSVATPFVSPNPAVKLAECQRYFVNLNPNKGDFTRYAVGYAVTSNKAHFVFKLPTPMRISPTVNYSGKLRLLKTTEEVSSIAVTSMTVIAQRFQPLTDTVVVEVSCDGELSPREAYYITNGLGYSGDSAAYIAFSAELS